MRPRWNHLQSNPQKLVREAGFEPATIRFQTEDATKLHHSLKNYGANCDELHTRHFAYKANALLSELLGLNHEGGGVLPIDEHIGRLIARWVLLHSSLNFVYGNRTHITPLLVLLKCEPLVSWRLCTSFLMSGSEATGSKNKLIGTDKPDRARWCANRY